MFPTFDWSKNKFAQTQLVLRCMHFLLLRIHLLIRAQMLMNELLVCYERSQVCICIVCIIFNSSMKYESTERELSWAYIV